MAAASSAMSSGGAVVGDQVGPMQQPRCAAGVVRRARRSPPAGRARRPAARPRAARRRGQGRTRSPPARRNRAGCARDPSRCWWCMSAPARRRSAISAVSAIGYSGRFSDTITTRSPAATPAARRCRAQDAAMRPNSPQVMRMPRAVAEHAQHRLVRPGPRQREHHRRQVGPGRIFLHVTSPGRVCVGRNPLTSAPTYLTWMTTAAR